MAFDSTIHQIRGEIRWSYPDYIIYLFVLLQDEKRLIKNEMKAHLSEHDNARLSRLPVMIIFHFFNFLFSVSYIEANPTILIYFILQPAISDCFKQHSKVKSAKICIINSSKSQKLFLSFYFVCARMIALYFISVTGI